MGGTGGYCEALVFFSHLLYLRVCLRVRHGGFWLGEETEGLELGLFGLRWESWDGWDLLILRERVILMVVVVGGDWVGSDWVDRVLLFFFCSSL